VQNARCGHERRSLHRFRKDLHRNPDLPSRLGQPRTTPQGTRPRTGTTLARVPQHEGARPIGDQTLDQHHEQQHTKPDVPLSSPEADQAQAEVELRKRLAPADGSTSVTLGAIPIDRIVVDEKFQIRNSLTEDYVRRYTQRYKVEAELPPVEVALVNGAYFLIDGFHRLEALRRLGRTEASARIRILPDLNAVLWEGFEINSRHGVHYTKDERRKGFKLYLRMGRQYVEGKPRTPRWLKSLNQIGKEWGISPHTIKKLIQQTDRRLWADYEARGEGRLENGNGGLRASKKITPEEIAKRSIANVLAVAQGITSPEARGEIIDKTEAAAEEMKKNAPWTPFAEVEF